MENTFLDELLKFALKKRYNTFVRQIAKDSKISEEAKYIVDDVVEITKKEAKIVLLAKLANREYEVSWSLNSLGKIVAEDEE